MANTWGALTWNTGLWGQQGNLNQSVTGQALSSSIGNETITANADVSISGISLTSSQGSTVGGTSALVNVTGQLLTSSIGEEIIDIGVIITGIAATTSVGVSTIDETTLIGEGWGRGGWNDFAWGVNFSAQGTGQALTTSIGSESVTTDVTVGITGQQLTFAALGTFSIQIDSSVSIVQAGEKTINLSLGTQSLVQSTVESVTGQSLTSSVGQTEAGLLLGVPVTGSAVTTSLGNQSLVQSTVETVSGQSMTSSLGSIGDIPQNQIGVTGQSLTLSLGEESSVGNALVLPTGVALTSSIGNPNITAWAEVQVGVSNTWTEVDIAA